MDILVSTLLFLISLLIVIYLAMKFRYFREQKNKVQKRKIKNVVDVTLATSILVFSIMHINSFINGLLTGQESDSYLKYIFISILAYFAWIFINVYLYRKEVKIIEQKKKLR